MNTPSTFNPVVDIMQGDALTRLKALPDESVHLIVTSPPYFWLRNYDSGEKEIGTEPTMKEYIDNLTAVFAECRRVLRSDGTLWVNIADTRTASGRGQQKDGMSKSNVANNSGFTGRSVGTHAVPDGLKAGELCNIPFRLCIALQDLGYWHRSTVIWHKPVAKPESVQNRPSDDFEYIFVFSKARRGYFYDNMAVRRQLSTETIKGLRQKVIGEVQPALFDNHTPTIEELSLEYGGANLRAVWSIPPDQNQHKSHFAVFPRTLVERIIKLGTSEKGVCGECGKPMIRQIEYAGKITTVGRGQTIVDKGLEKGGENSLFESGKMNTRQTTGWLRQCEHENAPLVPATVLDPFGGSGTTAVVALSLSRNAQLIELNPRYCMVANRLIKKRCGFLVKPDTIRMT